MIRTLWGMVALALVAGWAGAALRWAGAELGWCNRGLEGVAPGWVKRLVTTMSVSRLSHRCVGALIDASRALNAPTRTSDCALVRSWTRRAR